MKTKDKDFEMDRFVNKQTQIMVAQQLLRLELMYQMHPL